MPYFSTLHSEVHLHEHSFRSRFPFVDDRATKSLQKSSLYQEYVECRGTRQSQIWRVWRVPVRFQCHGVHDRYRRHHQTTLPLPVCRPRCPQEGSPWLAPSVGRGESCLEWIWSEGGSSLLHCRYTPTVFAGTGGTGWPPLYPQMGYH